LLPISENNRGAIVGDGTGLVQIHPVAQNLAAGISLKNGKMLKLITSLEHQP